MGGTALELTYELMSEDVSELNLRKPDSHPALSSSVERAIEILRAGGIVGIPTDTVYGIAANALDPEAVGRVFAAKGRDDGNPSPALVGGVEDLFEYAIDVSEEAVELARAFWPGKLTIVVRKSDRIPLIVSGGLDTVGLRVSSHPIPRKLAAALGAPITGTSANASGSKPSISAVSVVETLGARLDMVFDGGELAPSKPSTVIDATTPSLRILREGAVSRAEIEKVTGATPDV